MAQIAADRLDVSLDWLLGRTDDPKINDQEPAKRPRGDQCLQNVAGKHVMHFDLALAFVIVARPELKLSLTNIAKPCLYWKPRLVLNEDHRFVHSFAPACWERIHLQGEENLVSRFASNVESLRAACSLPFGPGTPPFAWCRAKLARSSGYPFTRSSPASSKPGPKPTS